ncbi:hypothetical protein ABZ114_02985 [Streptomyces albidoflavus]|uniref:hypothetical protein n=1 Tax=Streptomyces albidoflavus TaxID=1886 RepID=UPI0033A4ABCC
MIDKQRETYEYEAADGRVFVRILAAERKTYTTYSGVKSEKVEELRGRVQVATDAEFEGRVSHGFVKVRGRKYATEHTVARFGPNALDHLGQPRTWDREPTWRGGARNELGRQVSYEAKAYDAIREIEFAALDRFEKDNPDWARESYRLLFERERGSKEREAKRLRQEAATADRMARDWQKRIDELAA